MADILKIIVVVGTTGLDAFLFFRCIRKDSKELKYTYIMLQVIYGVIAAIINRSMFTLMFRLLLAALCFLFTGGDIKFYWGISVFFGIYSVVQQVMKFTDK